MKWRVALLLALALAQMAGDLLGMPALKGVAAATAASPAPKVFSAVRGLETFSVRTALWWEVHYVDSARITPELASRMRGPYNRRNVYGAVLAYGPVLAYDPRTKPMFEAVLRYALCPPAPLLEELGIDARGASRFEVSYEGAPSDLPQVIEVPCP